MSMKMITDVTIDLYGEIKYYMASAKQGDKATRYLRVQLMNNGNEFQIPEDIILIANIKKPDGKFCYNQCDRENNRVMVQLTSQALAAAGTAYCDIEMRDRDDKLILSSAAFSIEIEKSMRSEDAIESCNEITFLEKKIQQYIDSMLEVRKQVLSTEEAFKIAEAARVLAESERINAENTRQENELVRIENEEIRQEQFLKMKKATDAATTAADRAEAATDMVVRTDETAKIAEAARVLAESERINAENTRQENELKRIEAENIRQEHLKDKANPHKVTKAQVGLGNVDNTADIDKPVSTAQQEVLDRHTGNNTIHITSQEKDNWNDTNAKKHTHSNKSILDKITQALLDSWNAAYNHISDAVKHITAAERTLWNTVSNKVDKVSGKGLSTNDYTTAEKNKLAGIATGANKTIVDSALSDSSINPVQNKIVKTELDKKLSASICSVSSQNTSNYQWHRIAYTDTITSAFSDKDVMIMIKGNYSTGPFGIVKISVRGNGEGQTGGCTLRWIIRQGYSVDAIQAGFHNVYGSIYADLFLKVGTYARTNVTLLDIGGNGWTLCNSNEGSNGGKGSNVYTSITNAGTELRGKAYSSIVLAEDGSIVLAATKATNDSAGNPIHTTYIKGLSASGKTITYTKGNGTTGTITTQDTTYSNMSGATASAAGKAGLVPVPAAGKQTSFLRGDGTWATPANTWRDITDSLTSTSTTISLSAKAGKNLKDSIDTINNNLKQNTAGKFILPNGLKICWGKSKPPNTNGYIRSTVVNFPVTFNAVPVVCVTKLVSNSYTECGVTSAVGTITEKQFNIKAMYQETSLSDLEVELQWIAIGY